MGGCPVLLLLELIYGLLLLFYLLFEELCVALEVSVLLLEDHPVLLAPFEFLL